MGSLTHSRKAAPKVLVNPLIVKPKKWSKAKARAPTNATTNPSRLTSIPKGRKHPNEEAESPSDSKRSRWCDDGSKQISLDCWWVPNGGGYSSALPILMKLLTWNTRGLRKPMGCSKSLLTYCGEKILMWPFFRRPWNFLPSLILVNFLLIFLLVLLWIVMAEVMGWRFSRKRRCSLKC